MKTRNIKHSDGKGESFAVSRHIILRNFWEYYVEEPNENGMTFGFVMGFENEWGSVDYNEIKPYIISEAKAEFDGPVHAVVCNETFAVTRS